MNYLIHRSLYYYYKGGRFLSDLSKTFFGDHKIRERNTYFNNSLYQYVNLNTYTDLLQVSASLNPIHTATPIQPDILGGNVQNTLLKYGKPDFIFNDNKIKIYLYERRLSDLKIRCEIHFYNFKIFLVNYIYTRLDNSDKNSVIKTVTAKYLCQNINDINIFNSKIVDDNSDIIFFNEFVEGLRITYLSSKKSEWLMGMTHEKQHRILNN